MISPPRRWLALLALAVLACRRAPPPDLSLDPAALLEAVRSAQARVVRVRGSAAVGVDAPGRSGKVQAWIAAEKPDRLHVEALDFFGNPTAVLVAAGGRFGMFDAREGTFYRGEATPENLALLLPVTMPASDLVTLLCGSVPILAGEPVSVEPGDGVLLLSIESGGFRQRLAVGERAAVEGSRVRLREGDAETPAGNDVDFGLFRHRAGVRFPLESRLDAPLSGARMDLSWKDDLEVNGAADAAPFRISPPQGARVVDLARASPLPAVRWE